MSDIGGFHEFHINQPDSVEEIGKRVAELFRQYGESRIDYAQLTFGVFKALEEAQQLITRIDLNIIRTSLEVFGVTEYRQEIIPEVYLQFPEKNTQKLIRNFSDYEERRKEPQTTE
jgi:hypothetical protein